MSYAAAAALQAALHERLTQAPALAGVPVLDAVPGGQAPATYVLIGPEEVRDASDKSGPGAEHRLVVSVVSRAAGFAAAKGIAVAVTDVLSGPVPALARGRLAGLWFVQAEARRLDNGATRRVDLTFRARVEL
ncbi:MAG: DUF3168 domain-containing protein [Gemmobacter sp.]|uniref:DUF3168 domain-containing protein n=1 Tax=Gemmobacter sp. TaxID=1898957 RepID=UPI003918AEA2